MRKIYSYQGAYSKKQAAPHNSKANRHGGYGYKPPKQGRSRRPREASEAKSLWMIAFFPLTFLYYELLLHRTGRAHVQIFLLRAVFLAFRRLSLLQPLQPFQKPQGDPHRQHQCADVFHTTFFDRILLQTVFHLLYGPFGHVPIGR